MVSLTCHAFALVWLVADTVASPWSTANYVRNTLSTALRSREAYQVNLLLGGFGDDSESKESPQV